MITDTTLKLKKRNIEEVSAIMEAMLEELPSSTHLIEKRGGESIKYTFIFYVVTI